MGRTFAGALRRVMRQRKINADEVAEAVGVSRSTVSTWLVPPHHIPTAETAAKLSKLFDAPILVTVAHEERARTCDFCGVEFVALNRRSVARFCSGPCRTRWWHVQRAKESHERRIDHLTMLRNQVEELLLEKSTVHAAILAHCYECEPDGVCRDGACHLRGVSPLILLEKRSA